MGCTGMSSVTFAPFSRSWPYSSEVPTATTFISGLICRTASRMLIRPTAFSDSVSWGFFQERPPSACPAMLTSTSGLCAESASRTASGRVTSIGTTPSPPRMSQRTTS